MPRRRKKERRFFAEHLTAEQEFELIHGQGFERMLGGADPPAALSRAERLRLWRHHRATLMAACGPGARPWAYFVFDLLVDPAPGESWSQIGFLDERGLLSREEELLLERQVPDLAPGQDARDRFFDAGYSTSTLQDVIEQAGMAERWHGKRGRVELAEKFRSRAERLKGELHAGN